MSHDFMRVLSRIIGVGGLFLSGCLPQPKTQGPMGAATVDELVERYKKAHEAKDIESLRALFFWNAQRLTSGAGKYFETDMKRLCEYPLNEVRYVDGPGPDAELSAEVIYFLPGENKQNKKIGPIYGKILLILDNGQIVDPSYIVMKFDQGDRRYYIDILDLVFKDAVEALSEGRKPKYVGASLEKVPDARKGEKLREFK